MRFPFLNRLLNTVLFYCGWILCLKEAAEGEPFYGLLLIFLIVAYQFYRSLYKKADALLFGIIILIGPLSDVLYTHLGLLQYQNSSPFSEMPPLWIFFLWALFASNISLFSWMRKHWMLMTAFGAVGGPISYLSAVRLGGANLMRPLPMAVLLIGAVWTVFLPSFLWLNQKLRDKFKG